MYNPHICYAFISFFSYVSSCQNYSDNLSIIGAKNSDIRVNSDNLSSLTSLMATIRLKTTSTGRQVATTAWQVITIGQQVTTKDQQVESRTGGQVTADYLWPASAHLNQKFDCKLCEGGHGDGGRIFHLWNNKQPYIILFSLAACCSQMIASAKFSANISSESDWLVPAVVSNNFVSTCGW